MRELNSSVPHSPSTRTEVQEKARLDPTFWHLQVSVSNTSPYRFGTTGSLGSWSDSLPDSQLKRWILRNTSCVRLLVITESLRYRKPSNAPAAFLARQKAIPGHMLLEKGLPGRDRDNPSLMQTDYTKNVLAE